MGSGRLKLPLSPMFHICATNDFKTLEFCSFIGGLREMGLGLLTRVNVFKKKVRMTKKIWVGYVNFPSKDIKI